MQIRGANENEGVSFFYQLGWYGLIVDAGLDPKESTTREEIIQIYMNLDRRLDGILLTHTHNDHARAAVWLADYFNIPIFTGQYGRLQLQSWAQYDKINFERIKVNIIAEGDIIECGPAKITIVRWSHSTRDPFGFSIRVGGKHIVHLGDGKLTGIWKESYDQNLAMLRGLAETPIDLLVMDVLMIKKPGKTKPELPVIENIAKTILDNPGQQIFVFQYASNDDRIHGILATVFQWIEEKPEYASFLDNGIRFLFQGTAMKNAVERMAKEKNLPNLRKTLDRREATTTVIFGTTGGDELRPSYDKKLAKFSVQPDAQNKQGPIVKTGDVIVYSSGFISDTDEVLNEKRKEDMRQMFKTFHNLGAKIFVNFGFDRFMGIEKYVTPGVFSVGGHELQDGLKTVISTLAPQMLMPFHVLVGSYTVLQRLIGDSITVLQPNNCEPQRIGSV
jgi:mRNA degradation ribonuclease J1/J2